MFSWNNNLFGALERFYSIDIVQVKPFNIKSLALYVHTYWHVLLQPLGQCMLVGVMNMASAALLQWISQLN